MTTEMRKLTRADLLQGTRATKNIPLEELGGFITIRPLTDGEWAKVQQMKAAGGMQIQAKPKAGTTGTKLELDRESLVMNINPEDMTRQNYEADCQAVAYAIVDDKPWSVSEVRQLSPPGIVARLAQEVYALSGVTAEAAAQAAQFRHLAGGADTAGAGADGPPAGADAGGPNAPAA